MLLQQLFFTSDYFEEMLVILIKGFVAYEAISLGFKIIYHYLKEKITKKVQKNEINKENKKNN